MSIWDLFGLGEPTAGPGPDWERRGRGTVPTVTPVAGPAVAQPSILPTVMPPSNPTVGPFPSIDRRAAAAAAPAAQPPRPQPRPAGLGQPPVPTARSVGVGSQPPATPQRPGIGDVLGGLFTGEGGDMWKRLAIGLQGMTMRPNQALIDMLQSDLEASRANKDKNRTVAWLQTLGTEKAAQAAAALETGAIDAASAVKFALDPAADNIQVVGKRLVRINPDGTTEDITPGGDPAQGQPQLDTDQLGELNTLRDDLRTQTADFAVVKNGYDNVAAFYANPGAVSDYALAVGFAKIVDPGSVAREGEVAAVQNAGAMFPALAQSLRNAFDGSGRLTPEARKEIADLAAQIYTNKARDAEATIARFQDLARAGGLPPDLIWMGSPITYPQAAAPNSPAPTPTVPFTVIGR